METFPSKSTALLVIDLQDENLSDGVWPVAGYQDVLKNAATAINSCRKAGIQVIYSRHWLDPKGWNAMKYEPVDNNGRPVHSVAGSPNSAFCDEVTPNGNDIVIDKQRFTAFYNTSMDLTLSKLGADHLIILGVWTEACLETTVWDALWRDYRITLVKDACGSSTDAMHKVAILDMANWLYGGNIITADEFEKALDGQPHKIWNFTTANSYPYSLDNVEDLYNSI